MPGRAEGGEPFAEALVVNGSRVDGEQSHQQNQIPSTEHHPPDLTQGHVLVHYNYLTFLHLNINGKLCDK